MFKLSKLLCQLRSIPLQQQQKHRAFHVAAVRRSLQALLETDYIVVAQSSADEKSFENRKVMRFPKVWLRDNCMCDKCFHQSSNSRQFDWSKFDSKLRVLSLTANDKSITIDWNDKHKSTYALDWLTEREFSADYRKEYLNLFYRPKTEHWGKSDFDRILSTFEYEQVMQNDDDLRKWLLELAVHGVSIIKNAGVEKNAIRKLADRVGFIRRTTYGEEFYVEAKPGAKNYAYLSTPLPLHTDLPYYEYKPSVNLLHCLVQSNSEGGANLLTDAFNVADILKRDHPKYFEILKNTVVDWNDIGEDGGIQFHNIWRSPVICLDEKGCYTRINHSIPQRDSHFNVSLEEVTPWYEAYRMFVKLLDQEAISFKSNPGDIITFNNIRMVHGRTGYEDNETNTRSIVGAYLDWDIIYSKLRVLIKQNEKKCE